MTFVTWTENTGCPIDFPSKSACTLKEKGNYSTLYICHKDFFHQRLVISITCTFTIYNRNGQDIIAIPASLKNNAENMIPYPKYRTHDFI